ncbi:hypothetical protein [Flavobacterium sp.]|uniref:hypothetical protein n=1 Tax=Flavobacterium sp. TaxID=239 RepID=UPI0026085A3A|nr:hypothetical protein [Flavobacterium sp.]
MRFPKNTAKPIAIGYKDLCVFLNACYRLCPHAPCSKQAQPFGSMAGEIPNLACGFQMNFCAILKVCAFKSAT